MTYVGTVPCCWLLPFVPTVVTSDQTAIESVYYACACITTENKALQWLVVDQSEHSAEYFYILQL